MLDEVETLQRVRGDVRERALNALSQLIDEIDAGRYPGLLLVITGTPAFFDGPQGVQRLPPLASRLATDFATDAQFDNPRAIQIRLSGFDIESLRAGHASTGYLRRRRLRAGAGSGRRCVPRRSGASRDWALGGRVGVAPRVFLKKLVADVLDRVDQFADFDPRQHYALTLSDGELTEVERAAASSSDPDEVELDL